jgi:hypothetical protein
MSSTFHEHFRHEDVSPPSERSTGLVFAVVAAILAAVWRDALLAAVPLAGLSVTLGIVSWWFPRVLRPLNLLWFRFGMQLHRIVNPVVMLALFAIAIVPAGLVMQRLRDPLLKHRKPPGESYWVDVDESARTGTSMRHQF